jgi:5-methylcytosine-specific restriction protein A
MPQAPKRPCHHSNCPALTDDGWCDSHRSERWQDGRESSTKRSYDRKWRTWRLRFLQAHPLCIDCLDRDIVKAADQIHHILKVAEHRDRQYDETNCMDLCESCHGVRTQRGE